MSGIYISNIEFPEANHIIVVYPSGRVMDVETRDSNEQHVFKESVAYSIPSGRFIDASKLGLTDLEILLCKTEKDPFKEALKMLLDKIEKAESVIPE